jgi:hypothetical protein
VRLLREQESAPGDADQRRVDAKRHAAAFTWSENAKQTIAVYRRAFEGLGAL